MKVSKKARYGLRALVDLAVHGVPPCVGAWAAGAPAAGALPGRASPGRAA